MLQRTTLLLIALACGTRLMGTAPAAHSSEITKIAREQGQSIVLISALDRNGQVESLGSGVVISPAGLILTNYHVVDEGEAMTVRFRDGKTYRVRGTVGIDRAQDVAVIKVDAPDLPAVRLGDSEQVEVGQEVVAISNPRGFINTVSTGIVSARDRTIGRDRVRYLQTTAPISAGSSGGGLFNIEGELIGLLTRSYEGVNAQNLNFAVPVNSIKPLLEEFTHRPLLPLHPPHHLFARLIAPANPSGADAAPDRTRVGGGLAVSVGGLAVGLLLNRRERLRRAPPLESVPLSPPAAVTRNPGWWFWWGALTSGIGWLSLEVIVALLDPRLVIAERGVLVLLLIISSGLFSACLAAAFLRDTRSDHVLRRTAQTAVAVLVASLVPLILLSLE